MVHFLTKCSCGTVISQCRCMGEKLVTIIERGCSRCQQTPPPRSPACPECRPETLCDRHDLEAKIYAHEQRYGYEDPLQARPDGHDSEPARQTEGTTG